MKLKEDLAMRGTILVAVKALNQVEAIVSQLKGTVNPGTRVVFLVHSPVSSFQLSCLSIVDSLQQPGASGALGARYSSFGAEMPAAWESYSRQGMDVSVDSYAGSLRQAIRKYTARENVQLIIMANGAGPGYMKFLGRIFPFSRFSTRRHIPPALLVRTDLAA